MKIFKLFLLIASLLVIASPAYALQCKAGNYEASDECWTTVQISASETIPVVAGTVLVYDFASAANSNDAAWQVRVSTEATYGARVSGIAQKSWATGDVALVKVRGKGFAKVEGAVTSGDALFVAATDGSLRKDGGATSRDNAIAFALKTETAAATSDVYITIV